MFFTSIFYKFKISPGGAMTTTFSRALKPTVRQYNFLWQRFWVSNQVAPFYLSLIRVEMVRASCARLMKPFVYDLLKKMECIVVRAADGSHSFSFSISMKHILRASSLTLLPALA